MKRIALIAIAFGCFAACKNDETKAVTADEKSTAKVEYPYTIEHPDNWDPGSQENTLMVLKAYKAYETGNIDDALQYFADTVHIVADNFDQHLSKDSMAQMIKSGNVDKTTKIRMGDWESVISKDKTKQYVSLWYVETQTDKSGKVDSVFMMDDVEIKNGKIIEIDGKQRRFPMKKM